MNLHRKVSKLSDVFAAIMLCAVLLTVHAYANVGADPLPSWNNGPAKLAIMSFVKEVTDKSGAKYVEPEDRIATFDQDGTLWVEHPLYAQAVFALARVHELASQHPEWKQHEPFKAVLANDREVMARFSESDWEIILAATHAGMTTEAFQKIVREWLSTAKDLRFHRPYTELVYRPMLEVMEFLRASGFKTYIVTGGGQEFVRVYSQRVYGIPPEQVVGSSILTKYEYRDGKPVLMREPKVFFVDDRTGKPIGINLFIGKRPHAAFGNSTGDQQMLEWTQAGDGARLMMLVCTMIQNASTHTVPLRVCRTARLALSPMRCWLKPRNPAGSLLVSRTTGNAFSISRSDGLRSTKSNLRIQIW